MQYYKIMPKKLQKILPQPDSKNHLSKYGYKLDEKKASRQSSLKRASKKLGTLQVLKRVNLIRNLTKSSLSNKKKLSSDVEYMKKMYDTKKKNKKLTKK